MGWIRKKGGGKEAGTDKLSVAGLTEGSETRSRGHQSRDEKLYSVRGSRRSSSSKGMELGIATIS